MLDRSRTRRLRKLQGFEFSVESIEFFSDCFNFIPFLVMSQGEIRIRHVEHASRGITSSGDGSHTGAVLDVARCGDNRRITPLRQTTIDSPGTTGSRGHLLMTGGHDGKIKLFDPRGRHGISAPASTVSQARIDARHAFAPSFGTALLSPERCRRVTTLCARSRPPSGRSM